MIDRIEPVAADGNELVPVWMLNRRINQINDAIRQIEQLLELATPNTATQEKHSD